jgi:hypothetical protein
VLQQQFRVLQPYITIKPSLQACLL